jgi:serine/threonine protein kinase
LDHIDEDVGVPAQALREMFLLKSMKHDNVVKLLHVDCKERTRMERNRITLVFEYVAYDLYYLLQKEDFEFSSEQVKDLSRQLLSGLHYCHSMGIMHRYNSIAHIIVLIH